MTSTVGSGTFGGGNFGATAFVPTSLVKVEQLAAFLRRDLDPDDPTAQLLLDAATATVREFCGWHIAPEITEIVIVDGSGLAIQPLPTMYLSALTAVLEQGVALDVDWIDWSTYGVLEKPYGGYWTHRRRGVQAGITHGFPEAPAWLVTLICSLAGRAMTTTTGIAAESAGGESITYATPSLVPPGAVLLLGLEKTMLSRIALPTVA